MNHSDSQKHGEPTHVYLLQMDSSINLSSSEQVLPLHLLDNNLDYGHNQYFLPFLTKSKEGQDQLQVLIDSSHEPDKVEQFLVNRNCQNMQNLLPISDVYSQVQPIAECSNIQNLSLKRSEPDSIKYQMNTTVEVDTKHGSDYHKESLQNFVHISDRSVLPRALAVLPSVLQIQRRTVIATRRTIPMRARFGPVQGIKQKVSETEAMDLVVNAASNKKALFLMKGDNNLITHIDTTDKDKSNWIGLLPLGDENSANVWIYEENHELYAITTEIIPSRKPLMLGYSKKYAEDYALVGPTKNIERESQVQKPWWCYECQRALPSANMLQRHMDMYHKEDNQVSRRRYRCRHCTRTFSRIFTLRRHTRLHCLNKLDKRTNVVSTEVEPQINLNVSLSSGDNRIPSDESFQNYSNGLDFSTNLFDTDRIPSLDISMHSKSDNDFNPYSIENDLDFPSRTELLLNSNKEKQQKPDEQFLVACPYCNQIVVKEKKRQHVRACPARRFECECKKVFTNKNKLANHIYTQHTNKGAAKTNNDNSSVDTNPTHSKGFKPYKCEQCQHTFKRRGMLVNHLWRIHNTLSARVPLERRVRHYPCVICPKIYRTAAKRDRHVQHHHPGAEKLRGQALEGGTRLCEPAMCSACPRQYATRAKLLQHQRAHHPHLVPSSSNKNPLKPKSNITGT